MTTKSQTYRCWFLINQNIQQRDFESVEKAASSIFLDFIADKDFGKGLGLFRFDIYAENNINLGRQVDAIYTGCAHLSIHLDKSTFDKANESEKVKLILNCALVLTKYLATRMSLPKDIQAERIASDYEKYLLKEGLLIKEIEFEKLIIKPFDTTKFLFIVTTTIEVKDTDIHYDLNEIQDFINNTGTYENAPMLKHEHYSIFDCANKCGENGQRYIAPEAHINMLASVQPFISGSISKTINLPEEATVNDIRDIHTNSWKLGLKCVAIYRDASKLSQPLSTSNTDKKYSSLFKIDNSESNEPHKDIKVELRKKLPDERKSITHKFSVAGHEGYITVGLYEDGFPGEVFVTMSKDGSTMNGIVNAWAVTMSLALQHGVPIKSLIDKFVFTRFEPAGMTNNKLIPISQSIVDYLGRWLALKFLPKQEALHYLNPDLIDLFLEQDISRSKSSNENTIIEQKSDEVVKKNVILSNEYNEFLKMNNEDAPICSECGSVTVRNGTCYKCLNCGTTTGCS